MTDSNKYKAKSLTDEFHIKNFILHYKIYVDIPMLKADEKKFGLLLDKTRNELMKVGTLQKNTLFVCNEDISRNVFLAAFSLIPKLVTHRYMNFLDVIDVWEGNARYNNDRIDSDDMFQTEQDIKEDVLCIFIDKDMCTNALMRSVLDSLIVSRSARINNDGNYLLTWIFFKGTEEEMKSKDVINTVYRLYNSNKDKYQVVNLSETGLKPSNSSVVGNNATSLNEMY